MYSTELNTQSQAILQMMETQVIVKETDSIYNVTLSRNVFTQAEKDRAFAYLAENQHDSYGVKIYETGVKVTLAERKSDIKIEFLNIFQRERVRKDGERKRLDAERLEARFQKFLAENPE